MKKSYKIACIISLSISIFAFIVWRVCDIRPGDIFIQVGFPGHAVTVVDVAVNRNNEKVYMLAQSYMPAQEQHILLNPKNNTVWYNLENLDIVYTPEFTFESNQLRRFKN